MSFSFKKLGIPEVILIEPKVFSDSRGFFMETYKHSEFSDYGIEDVFVQGNHSKSEIKGIIRGLHFQQAPMAQAKLVRVIAGSIFDVAVDIRLGSPTYKQWVARTLSAANKEMLYMPAGFAHGFCVLEPNTEVIYKCSKIYSPEHDKGILYNDESIAVDWPIKQAKLSEKDRALPLLKEIEGCFKHE